MGMQAKAPLPSVLVYRFVVVPAECEETVSDLRAPLPSL